MSIKLAAGEKIIRNYDYGKTKTKNGVKSSNSSKSLIVTNKRIIHKIISTGTGSESISLDEMPVSSAKYVNTYYKKSSSISLLIFGILLSLLGIFSIIKSPSNSTLAFLETVLGVIFVVLYFTNKSCSLICNISTDSKITPAMSLSTNTINNNLRGIFARSRNNVRNIKIKVSIDKDIAKKLAIELGAVIMAAASGEYNSIEED